MARTSKQRRIFESAYFWFKPFFHYGIPRNWGDLADSIHKFSKHNNHDIQGTTPAVIGAAIDAIINKVPLKSADEITPMSLVYAALFEAGRLVGREESDAKNNSRPQG